MNRRQLLHAFSAVAASSVLTPELAQAAAQLGQGAAAGLDWKVGFADLDADLPRAAMRRIHGRAPEGLAGSLYRNGPGKFHRPGGSVDHWFDGDGLMRAFRITDGAATLEARFVDTPKRRTDTAANAVVTPGFGTAAKPGARVRNNDDVNAANISVMPVGDEVWALWEGGSPIAMNAGDLSTIGIRTLRDDLAHVPFLAHPRREPGGDTWSLGVSGSKALVWRLGPDGGVRSADMVELPAASYIHDFTATRTHLILVLQPWIQDRMVMPYNDSFTWKPELGTKVLVLDKSDLSRRRIYELPSFFAFHYGAAWEESDGTIRFDGCFTEDPKFATINGRALMTGQWVEQPASILGMVGLHPDGRATLERTGVAAEFPRSDGRKVRIAAPLHGPRRQRRAERAPVPRRGQPRLEDGQVRQLRFRRPSPGGGGGVRRPPRRLRRAGRVAAGAFGQHAGQGDRAARRSMRATSPPARSAAGGRITSCRSACTGCS